MRAATPRSGAGQRRARSEGDGAEHDQVEQHLDRDDQPRQRGQRDDVAEPDRGEDGHGEVQRGRLIEQLGEVSGRDRREREIEGDEQDQERTGVRRILRVSEGGS